MLITHIDPVDDTDTSPPFDNDIRSLIAEPSSLPSLTQTSTDGRKRERTAVETLEQLKPPATLRKYAYDQAIDAINGGTMFDQPGVLRRASATTGFSSDDVVRRLGCVARPAYIPWPVASAGEWTLQGRSRPRGMQAYGISA